MASASGISEVLVIGATGGCGKGAFNACKELGLNVRAFARSREKCERVLGASARVSIGDVNDPQTLEDAMVDVSHVIVALGAVRSEGDAGRPEIVEYEGMQKIVAAAKKQGCVKKIVNVSSYGVEEPNWFFAGFLNHMARDTLAWKMKAETVLRDSGIPYVVVRPQGLGDKDDDVPPIVKQTAPYEWGMSLSLVSRAVVGHVCANALIHSPDCVTVSMKKDDKAGKVGLAGFDWAAAFAQAKRDKPIAVSFADHMAGKASLQRKLFFAKTGFRITVGLLVVWIASHLLRKAKALK